MAISRENWQDALRRTIKLIPDKYKQEGITSLYIVVASLALLPVALAGGEWRTALATMIGGVGANLISNLLQNAKDELDVAHRIESLAVDDPIHKHIQELLNKIDAISIVKQGLPETDWERLELLFKKYSQHRGADSALPTLDAPILDENIHRKQALEISQTAIKKAWWSEHPVGKYKLERCHWPMVFYDAKYVVKYEDKIVEDIKDKDGNKVSTRTTPVPGTSSSKIQLVVFPTSIADRTEHSLPERVYETLNGLELERAIDWGENAFARKSYEILCIPVLGSWLYRFFTGKLTPAIKEIRYWENKKLTYSSKPGGLNTDKTNIIADAQHLAKRSIAHRWTTPRTSVLDTQPGQEQVRAVQYPFWIFEANSPSGLYQIVIEGLGGKVVFIDAFASRVAYRFVTLLGALVILLIASPLIFLVVQLVILFSKL